MWIEVTNHFANTNKIIYYADAKNSILMNWVDEETLSIINSGGGAKSNRNVVLKVAIEIYHENGLACQSLLMKNDYEECYQYENN